MPTAWTCRPTNTTTCPQHGLVDLQTTTTTTTTTTCPQHGLVDLQTTTTTTCPQHELVDLQTTTTITTTTTCPQHGLVDLQTTTTTTATTTTCFPFVRIYYLARHLRFTQIRTPGNLNPQIISLPIPNKLDKEKNQCIR